MTISPEAEEYASRYLDRERALHKAFKPQHDLLFGKLTRAIVDLENAVESRECARWRHGGDYFDSDAPTYEELDVRVQEARCKVVDEVIKLAASGVVPRRASVAP
jgi:hypothetical protein